MNGLNPPSLPGSAEGTADPCIRRDVALTSWSHDGGRIGGAADVIALPHDARLEGGEGAVALTFAADDVARRQGLLSKDASGFGDGGHLGLWVRNGSVVARLQSDDASHTLRGGSLVAGQEHHLALSFGEDGMRLFVDGALVAEDPYTGGLEGNREPVVIGASQWKSSPESADRLSHVMKGEIGPVTILATPLTQADAAALASGHDEAVERPPTPEPAPEDPPADAGSDPEPAPGRGAGDPIWSHGRHEGKGVRDATILGHDPACELSQGSLALTFVADDTGGKRGLFSKDARNFGDGGHLTVLIEDGRIVARLQSETGGATVTGGSIEAGRAHHVAVTFGEGGLELYVDGARVAKDAFAGGLSGNGEPIVLGANQWASSPRTADALKHGFSGSIADVRLYDAPASAERVAGWASDALGAADLPGAPPAGPVEAPANAAPEAVGASIEVTLDEGQSRVVDLGALFEDPDGDALAFELVRGPGFAAIEGDGLRLAPGRDASGRHAVAVTAFDGDVRSDAFEFDVVVRDVAPNGSPPSGDASGQRITLEAGKGALSGPVGAQRWGDGVTLAGFDLEGRPAPVVWSNEHRDDGFGVKGEGGRWDGQIDFFEGAGGRSERLEIDFGGPVTDAVLSVGMLGLDEGPRIDGDKAAETGRWTALDGRGRVVDEGLIGPELSALGRNVKVDRSYGTYPIEIDAAAPFETLAIEATQFEHGRGRSTERSYGENNSDLAVMGVSYVRLDDPGTDLL